MNKQQQLESVFDGLVDLVLRMVVRNPTAVPAIVEQIITLSGYVPNKRESVIKLEGTQLARLGKPIIEESEVKEMNETLNSEALAPKASMGDFKVNLKVLYQGEVEGMGPYVKKLKATVDPVGNDLRETIKNVNELMLIEDLALQVISLIAKNNLTIKQANALFECVQREVRECRLSR